MYWCLVPMVVPPQVQDFTLHLVSPVPLNFMKVLSAYFCSSLTWQHNPVVSQLPIPARCHLQTCQQYTLPHSAVINEDVENWAQAHF